jgi:hypothetical protein
MSLLGNLISYNTITNMFQGAFRPAGMNFIRGTELLQGTESYAYFHNNVFQGNTITNSANAEPSDFLSSQATCQAPSVPTAQ